MSIFKTQMSSISAAILTLNNESIHKLTIQDDSNVYESKQKIHIWILFLLTLVICFSARMSKRRKKNRHFTKCSASLWLCTLDYTAHFKVIACFSLHSALNRRVLSESFSEMSSLTQKHTWLSFLLHTNLAKNNFKRFNLAHCFFSPQDAAVSYYLKQIKTDFICKSLVAFKVWESYFSNIFL